MGMGRKHPVNVLSYMGELVWMQQGQLTIENLLHSVILSPLVRNREMGIRRRRTQDRRRASRMVRSVVRVALLITLSLIYSELHNQ